MLQRRLLWSLLGYFSLLVVIFTAIMLIPGLGLAMSSSSVGLGAMLRQLVAPLPALWMTLLPTVFMLTVLVTFSRLSLSGEVRIWRAAGTSVWPFARATALLGLIFGATITGPFWQIAQPKGVPNLPSEGGIYISDGPETWLSAPSTAPAAGQRIHLFNKAGDVIEAIVLAPIEGDALRLGQGWQSDGSAVTPFDTLSLTVELASPVESTTASVINLQGLAVRLSYPVLLAAVGLLMLPLALSIDGQRFTVLKITAACLLALNALFLLLMTDALAEAGLWDERLFFPLRAGLVLAFAGLLLLLTEERAA